MAQTILSFFWPLIILKVSTLWLHLTYKVHWWNIILFKTSKLFLKVYIDCILSHLSNVTLAEPAHTRPKTTAYFVCFVIVFTRRKVALLVSIALTFITISPFVTFTTRTKKRPLAITFYGIFCFILSTITIANHFNCYRSLSKPRYVDGKPSELQNYEQSIVLINFCS